MRRELQHLAEVAYERARRDRNVVHGTVAIDLQPTDVVLVDKGQQPEGAMKTDT